jgi:hypothetical protein
MNKINAFFSSEKVAGFVFAMRIGRVVTRAGRQA